MLKFSFLKFIFGSAGSSLPCGLLLSSCGGFSCCGTRALGCMGFSSCSARAQQLWFPGSRAQAQQLCCTGFGIFPDQGLNPGFLHWQEDFFTTEPPKLSFNIRICLGSWMILVSIFTKSLCNTVQYFFNNVNFRKKLFFNNLYSLAI